MQYNAKCTIIHIFTIAIGKKKRLKLNLYIPVYMYLYSIYVHIYRENKIQFKHFVLVSSSFSLVDFFLRNF